jgi:predicted amidohydrolase YtcJ
MDEPPIAEALLIEDGTVTAVGTRDDVLALADDQTPVIDIGQSVAYPGFIDAHVHWIGDRDYYGIETAGAAMDEALARGWTSISEQWVNPERLAELERLAADDALPLRVDAYLALNFGDDFLGDWYTDREPGPVDDHLRIRGLKVHLDDGWGAKVLWEPADLTAAIGRADEAGWQVSVHTVSTAAEELVLDAFEAALGPSGPNPLHHRIEHALQVTDEQLARMIAMDLAVVIHPDGAPDWVRHDDFLGGLDRDAAGMPDAWLNRWRDFVDGGLHVAAASDMPWLFPDFDLTDDRARPLDQIAAGMDGRGRAHLDTPEWAAAQLLTAEQGLRAVTLEAAWALGDEARRGHFAPGTLGDVTILSGDVTTATPDEIRAMKVVATIVGGIPVYCADPAICGRLRGAS